MERKEELKEIFKDIDENEKKLIAPLLDEVVTLEIQMEDLKQLPFISINPKNPTQQRTTAAAKLYKECSQSYLNAMRILINVLRKVDSAEMDELLKRLKEFE